MLKNLNKKTTGFLALILGAFALGCVGVFIRFSSNYFSDNGQIFARSSFATIIILVILWFKSINPFLVDKQNIKYLILFGISLPISMVLFTFSANTIKVSNSLFMLYIGSLVSTSLLGYALLKQKFTFKHVVSITLAVAGLSFFVYPFDIKSVNLGLVAGLLSGVFEGFCHTLRGLMKNLKREIVVFYQSISAVILTVIILFFSQENIFTQPSINGLIIAFLFGFLLVAIGYLLSYGFSHFDASLGTIILATELLFTLIINFVILSESPTILEIVGGVLIFCSTIVTRIDISKFNFNLQGKK